MVFGDPDQDHFHLYKMKLKDFVMDSRKSGRKRIRKKIWALFGRLFSFFGGQRNGTVSGGKCGIRRSFFSKQKTPAY